MDLSVAALVLLAALLHAGWNALVKVQGDRLVVMALIAAFAGLLSVFALPFVGAPARAAWPYLATSVVLHTGYKLFLIQAYRYGDLGHVYPVARGVAPLIVLAASVMLVGEALAGTSVLAIFVIGAGVISLAFRGGLPIRDDPRPLVYALGTATFIASYTVVDAIGARLAGTPHGYSAWLFLLDALPISLIALLRRRETAIGLLRRHWLAGLGGATMSLGAYWLVIWAVTLGPIAPVAALRETSVIFAAVIATVLLKERFGRWRVAASGAVALGLVLLRL